MPIYKFDCTVCGESKDNLMKYSERAAGLTCDCGSHMEPVITACHFKPSLGGAHGGRLTPPDVGPLSKTTKAYQKQQDDKHSKYYAPDQTFGQGSVAKFNKTQQKKVDAGNGKTNFS